MKDGSGKPGARWGARGARTWNGQPDPAGGLCAAAKRGTPQAISVYILHFSL